VLHEGGVAALIAVAGALLAGSGAFVAGESLLVAAVLLLLGETKPDFEQAFGRTPPRLLSYCAMPARVDRIAIIRQTTDAGKAQ
jgi:hypothetical protein